MRIDPIVVREHRDTLQRRGEAAAKGVKAADAILWFAEYMKEQPAPRVIRIDVTPVASATPNADLAARYIKAAADSFAEDILDRAVLMAKDDFDAAKKAKEPA